MTIRLHYVEADGRIVDGGQDLKLTQCGGIVPAIGDQILRSCPSGARCPRGGRRRRAQRTKKPAPANRAGKGMGRSVRYADRLARHCRALSGGEPARLTDWAGFQWDA